MIDELDRDLVAALTLGMALLDSADLRCAFKPSGRLSSDGDEEVREGGSEAGLYQYALLFVCRVL